MVRGLVKGPEISEQSGGAVTKLSKEEFLVLYKNVCLERVGNALVCPVLHKWVLFWHSRAEMSLNAIILSGLACS